MKLSVLKKNILIMTVVLYPFVELYSPIVSKYIGISGTQFILLYFIPSIIGNLKGISNYIFRNIPFYYIAVLITSLFLLWSIDLNRGYFYIISLIMASLFGYSIWKLNISIKVWHYFSVSTIIFALLLYFEILQKGFDVIYIGNRFGYIKGPDINLDPNWLAAWLSLSIIYFFLLLIGDIEYFGKKLTFLNKFILISLIILNMYFIIITSSRSATLALLVSLFIYSILKNKFLFVYFILSVLIIFILMQVFSSNYENEFLERFLPESTENEARIELFSVSIKALSENLSSFLFGYGTGSGDRIVGQYFTGAQLFEDGIYRYNNHNLYLDFILQTGVIGIIYLLVLLIILLFIIKKSVLTKNYPLIFVILFILIQSNFYNPIKNSFWIIYVGLLLSLLAPLNYKSKN